MRSNKLSSLYGFTTFGESHGPAMGIVIEDIKPNIEFPFEKLSELLQSRSISGLNCLSKRREKAEYQIVSGVFEGKTTGMPICILFWNRDIKSEDYDRLKEIFRPGHADLAWFNKFKIYDYRGGGRASGRETISRIAASAFVEDMIKPAKITFQTISIGKLKAGNTDSFFEFSTKNPFCWSDPDSEIRMHSYLAGVKKARETAGGIVRIRIENLPAGLGDPVFEKLNAKIAKALFSISTTSGVSFGDGFGLAELMGSEANDQMDAGGYLSNHSGGFSGGVSTGQQVIINIAVKPVSSHGNEQKTVNRHGRSVLFSAKGRHDVCHIPKLLPVMEAMIKLALADAFAWQNMITGKVKDIEDYREALDKLDEDILINILRRKTIVDLVRKYKEEHLWPFRDEGREGELVKRWSEIAGEFGLDEKDVVQLLNILLKICRNADTVDPL